MRVVQGTKNVVTQKYNILTHKGVDIGWKGGDNDNVLAHSDGTIISVVTGKKRNTKTTGTATYGNYVKIKHSNDYYTLYAHLATVDVKKGDKVKKGQKIGYMGESGKTYGKHLHFEVRNTKDVRINPTKYLNDDLPGKNDTIKYMVYDLKKKKWLPKVKAGNNDYAGNKGNAISALYVDQLEYCVHDKSKNIWLPYVKDSKSYAGNIGNAIDGIKVKNASYRVHIKGGGWLAWIHKVDNTNSGYAGIYGKEIDCVQIKKS